MKLLLNKIVVVIGARWSGWDVVREAFGVERGALKAATIGIHLAVVDYQV